MPSAETVVQVTEAARGPRGKSAYEVAVTNGFVGDEAAWLASLRGTDGTDGTDGVDGLNGSGGDPRVATLVDLAAIPLEGRTGSVQLTDQLRRGKFNWSNSDLHLAVAADPQRIIYQPPTGQDGTGGGWVREHNGTITHLHAGCQDATGNPKNNDEVVYDNYDKLMGLVSIWLFFRQQLNFALKLDYSAAAGLGTSRTIEIEANDFGATWNRQYHHIIPGRLVAMKGPAGEAFNGTCLIRFKHGNFQNMGGVFELYAGADTYLNAGDYGKRLVQNGIEVIGVAGSNFGDGFCQGFKRWGVEYSDATSVDNNQIITSWGHWFFIQCGTRNIDGVKPAGNYINGAYTNIPAMNGDGRQRHSMEFPLDGDIDPHDFKPGDRVIFGIPGDDTSMRWGAIRAITGYVPERNSFVADIYPIQPNIVTGQFLLVAGGGCDFQGGNTANNSFASIECYSCGVAARWSTLFGPTINNMLGEATLLGCQFGGEGGGESMQGIYIGQYHLESVFGDILDDATCFGARMGVASSLQGNERGFFDKIHRLVPAAYVGGVFIDPGRCEPLGITIEMDGEAIHLRGMYTKGRDLAGLSTGGAIRIGNAPWNRKFKEVYCATGMELAFEVEFSLADCSVKDRSFECIIYGPGTADGNAGNITISHVAEQPDVTIAGGAAAIIPPGDGAIWLRLIYEPVAGDDNGNVKVLMMRILGDAAGGGLADGDYGDVLVGSSGASLTVQGSAGDFAAGGNITIPATKHLAVGAPSYQPIGIGIDTDTMGLRIESSGIAGLAYPQISLRSGGLAGIVTVDQDWLFMRVGTYSNHDLVLHRWGTALVYLKDLSMDLAGGCNAIKIAGNQIISTRFAKPGSPTLADVIACLDHHGLWG